MPPLNRNKIDYDYILNTAQPLNVNWINGKPVYRFVTQFPGDNNQSVSPIIPEMATVENVVDIIYVFTNPPENTSFIGTGDSTIIVSSVPGIILIGHVGLDLTGQLATVVMQYTRV